MTAEEFEALEPARAVPAVTSPELVDRALSLVMGLVLEDGRTWGDAAAPWQVADARAILSGTPALHFVTRPRGGSKTSDLAALAIAYLAELAPAHGRAFAFAADRDQARLLVEAVAGYVGRTPGLSSVLAVGSLKVTNLSTGAELEAMAADAASAHGLRAGLFIVDELAVWPSSDNARGVWTAVVSAIPKVAGARLVCITAAGAPQHWAHRVLEVARASASWRVAELPGPVPWISAQALADQRALLTEAEYARLHLNVWTELDELAMTRDAVLACQRNAGALEPAPGVHYVHGVDLSVSHDYTVVATCHLEHRAGAAVVVLDRLRVWKPSKRVPISPAAVTDYVIGVARQYPGRVLTDPYGANSLREALEQRGIRRADADMTAAGNNRRARALNTLLTETRLELPGDDVELVDELSSLAFRETSPGVYRMDTTTGGMGHHDRATAISLAAFELVEHATKVPKLVDTYSAEPEAEPWAADPFAAIVSPAAEPEEHALADQRGVVAFPAGTLTAAPGGAYAIGGRPVEIDPDRAGAGMRNPWAPAGAEPVDDQVWAGGVRNPWAP